METCKCEYYGEILKKFKVWTPGCVFPLRNIESVPHNAILKWKKYSDDPFKTYPKIYEIYKPTMCSATTATWMCVETKWIPIEPGLISIKYVNQCRSLKNSPLY